MSRIVFYRQFKAFSCSDVCTFPAILFHKALGQCPVILLSVRAAVKLHQKQGTAESGSHWPFSVGLWWKTQPGEAPTTTKIMFVSLGAIKTWTLLPHYSIFEHICWICDAGMTTHNIYCFHCRARHSKCEKLCLPENNIYIYKKNHNSGLLLPVGPELSTLVF